MTIKFYPMVEEYQDKYSIFRASVFPTDTCTQLWIWKGQECIYTGEYRTRTGAMIAMTKRIGENHLLFMHRIAEPIRDGGN